MVIASLAELGRLDRPGADFHAGVNFALTEFSEVGCYESDGPWGVRLLCLLGWVAEREEDKPF
jgi:hypothetical protein